MATVADGGIEALERFLAGSQLQFEVGEQTAELHAHSLREITIVDSDARVTVPVFDEFGDADIPSRVVRLHLVLDACAIFEEAEDREVWRADLGLSDEPTTQAVYQQLREVVPAVRLLVGTELAPVNSHDIEFNTSVAVRLRSCRD